MLEALNKRISQHSPLRLLYHKVMAMAAAIWYRFPADHLKVIAVTGTNGKTTTCHMITSILRAAGHKVGMITTSDFRIDEHVFPNDKKMTTLPPFMFQRLVRSMVDQGCEYLVFEATSHAMDQSRLWGVNVDTALLTNVTHDHLDYHGTMDNYLKAKGKLFANLNFAKRKPNIPKISIINADDPNADFFKQFVVDRMYMYGTRGGSFVAESVQLRPDGTQFMFKVPNDQIQINLPLPGRFNMENALGAATLAVALQINLKIIKHALETSEPVPGRLERIDEGQKYTAIVDYAHAADSLEKLLSMFRELTEKRLILVFGATGDRDKTKRPKMGEVADKYADLILLTNDDPYTENPIQIIEQVAKGIKRKEGDRFWKIPGRCQAIRVGLAVARAGDTVIVAGKGCEPYQVVGKEKIPSDDRLIVRDYLSRAVEVEISPGKIKTGNRYMES